MPSWDDARQLLDQMGSSLDAFDWAEVTRASEELVSRIARTREPMPAPFAEELLGALRRKRRFSDMERLADALEQSGQDAPAVLILHGQALIDQGKLVVARGLLQGLVVDASAPEKERFEGVGLLGRLHKQLYVNARRAAGRGEPPAGRELANLAESVRQYRRGWVEQPAANGWHGVNLVAMLARARRDGADVASLGAGDEREMAREVLRCVPGGDPWAAATAMEASVALERWPEAYAAVARYTADPRPDAFAYAGTLRQLTEVWQLTADREPGSLLLPALGSAIASRVGGEVALAAGDLRAGLQRNFGGEQRIPLAWWQEGLRRCAAVARIETHAGEKIGTGFLVDPRDFFGDAVRLDAPVLLTNWHVVSKGRRFPGSIAPADGCARFEAAGCRIPLAPELVGGNEQLDASFVALRQRLDPEIAGCPLRTPPPPFDPQVRQRVYVIGHPLGGDLSISIHDSVLLDTDGVWLHYRTPTEPGSSGSPVFDEKSWTVIGLHHAGRDAMPRLHGVPGTYQANEGIAVGAIREAVAANRLG
jgi:hypothetical protein